MGQLESAIKSVRVERRQHEEKLQTINAAIAHLEAARKCICVYEKIGNDDVVPAMSEAKKTSNAKNLEFATLPDLVLYVVKERTGYGKYSDAYAVKDQIDKIRGDNTSINGIHSILSALTKDNKIRRIARGKYKS